MNRLLYWLYRRFKVWFPCGAILFALLPALAEAAVRVESQLVETDGKRYVLVIGIETDDATGAILRVEQNLVPLEEPDAAPFPADKLHVLIVYETRDANQLTADQRAIIFGAGMRLFLKDACPEGPDGKTDTFRIYDADTDAAQEAEVWQKAMAVERKSLPWLAISNGRTGFSGPLDMKPDAFKELVRRHAR